MPIQKLLKTKQTCDVPKALLPILKKDEKQNGRDHRHVSVTFSKVLENEIEHCVSVRVSLPRQELSNEQKKSSVQQF